MKIAFWSSACSHSCVTATMTAISVAWALSCEPPVAITENHWNGFGSREMLGVPWSFGNAEKRENTYFYGESVYNRAIEHLSREIVFLENKLRYIPFYPVEENAVSGQTKEEVLMIDTAFSGMSTQVILQEAELVAVIFSQESQGIERFLENYASLLPKAVFFIGNYHKASPWTVTNLERQYHLPKEKMGIIPYNAEYAQAMREGRTIEFFNRYFYCNRNHANYGFIKESKLAAALLYQTMLGKRGSR